MRICIAGIVMVVRGKNQIGGPGIHGAQGLPQHAAGWDSGAGLSGGMGGWAKLNSDYAEQMITWLKKTLK